MDDGSPVDPYPQAEGGATSGTATSPEPVKQDQALGATVPEASKKSKKSKKKRKSKKKMAEAAAMETEKSEAEVSEMAGTSHLAEQEVTGQQASQLPEELAQVTEGHSLGEYIGERVSTAAEDRAEKQPGKDVHDLHEAGEVMSVKGTMPETHQAEVEEAAFVLQATVESTKLGTESISHKETEEQGEASNQSMGQQVPIIELTEVATTEGSEEKVPESGDPNVASIAADTTEEITGDTDVSRAGEVGTDQADTVMSKSIMTPVTASSAEVNKEGEIQQSAVQLTEGQTPTQRSRDVSHVDKQAELASTGKIPALQDISLTSTDSSLEGIFQQEAGRAMASPVQEIADDSFEKSQGIFPVSDLSTFYEIPEKLHSLQVELPKQAKLEHVISETVQTDVSHAPAEIHESLEITSPRSLVGDVIEQSQTGAYEEAENIHSDETSSEKTDDIIGDVIEHNFSNSSTESVIRKAAQPDASTDTPTATRVSHMDDEGILTQRVMMEETSAPTEDTDKESMTTDDMLAPDYGVSQDEDSSPKLYPRTGQDSLSKKDNVSRSYVYGPLMIPHTLLNEEDKSTISDIFDISGEQIDQNESLSDYMSDWRKETDISIPEKRLKLHKPDDISYIKKGGEARTEKLTFLKTTKVEPPRWRLAEGHKDMKYNIYPKYKEKAVPSGEVSFTIYKKYGTSHDKDEPTVQQEQHEAQRYYMTDSWQPDEDSEVSEDTGEKEGVQRSYMPEEFESTEKKSSLTQEADYDISTKSAIYESGKTDWEAPSMKSGKARELDNILQDAMDNAFKEDILKPYQTSVEDKVDIYADLMPHAQLEELISMTAFKESKPIKKVEDTVLRDTDNLQLRGPTEDSPSTPVPAKIREIITENLIDTSTPLPSMSSHMSETLKEENHMLKAELNRIEDLLSATRAERDEIGIKYNAVSERLESVLKSGVADVGGGDDTSTKSLLQQNIELRRRLEEDHSSYKRKLQAYQDGQQRQAQLVQKLQAKVLQYKRKCGELEETCRSLESDAERSRRLTSTQEHLQSRLDSTEMKLRQAESDHNIDLETALIKLEEEQQKSASLAHVNGMLREQLDQATAANQALTADIHKLTKDWQRAREELEIKEAEWREEEQSFNEYFSAEHGRLLVLWRAVVSFRRQFTEMKSATERDMSHIKADFSRAARSMHSACLNLSANQRNMETQSQVVLDRERSERVGIEQQLKSRVQEIIDIQTKFDAQSAELNARINELMVTNERLRNQLADKDKSIATLQRTVATLEVKLGRTEDPERTVEDIGRQERDEIDAMHEALKRIAQEVINDADQSLLDDTGDPELSTSVLRARSPLRSASRSPTRGRGRSKSPRHSPTRSHSPGFADSTYSAVQAALNKRQLQVSELRAKLTAARDQNNSVRKSVDDFQNQIRRLEQQMLSLKEERDNAYRSQQDAERNSDRMRNAHDAVNAEKSQLERVRAMLNEQIDGLTAENSKLQACNSELQRQRDQLEDEKEDVSKDKDRMDKENERCRRVIEQGENKLSKLKEDLVNTKEALNRALLEKEVLDQEKREISDALSKSEISKAELELEINKVKTEEASLRDALLKMQALNEGLGQDKIELNKIIMQLEAQNSSILGDKAAVEQEKTGLREELVRVEQEKLDVENEKQGLNHSLALTEKSRERLEEEIMILNKEKAEVTEQLNIINRQKASLAEELLNARKEIERQSETIIRIAKEKEDLTRDKAELTVQVTATERENRQQSEVIAAVKADKDALETQLYETQQLNASLESRKEQLEGENQELILKKENLIAEVQRTRKEMEIEIEKLERQKENLAQKLAQTEKDLQLALKQEQQAHEEDIDRLTKEKERQRAELESQREDILHRHSMEKEELITRYENDKEELHEELIALQRERDEQQIMAENEKQQALSLLEQEKSTIQEKLNAIQQELSAAIVDYDRLKRDAMARQESDRTSINNLNAEIKNIRAHFEDTCHSHEKEVKDMNNQIRELQNQKEAALREVAELKVQLKMVEETRDTIRRDLIEANRRIRELEEARELMRKEVTDLKRAVNEEIHEKEAVAQTAHDLRNMVKKAEGEKSELHRKLQESLQRITVLEEQKAGVQKEASDLRASLREVEKARLEARRELQELRRQVKTLDGERAKLSQEVNDLQAHVTRGEEKEEDYRRELFGLKQKLVETEAGREALRKELANLQRKFAEFEDETRLREKDFQLALEDSHRNERKLDDQRRNLEISLDNSNAELADFKLRLSGAEGRVNALETELARVEGAKRDVEFKISSIVSSLRRTIGFRADMPRARSPLRTRSPSPRRSRPNSPTKGFENTYATTTEGRGSPIPRTGSPDRARSPFRDRSLSPSRMEIPISIADIDPEAVRCALRDFVQHLASAERERDDSFSQLRSITCQLKEMEEDRNRIEARLQQLQKSLGEAEEGKRDIDGRLASAQTALMLQEETIRRNERERKQMAEKINELERHLAAAESERRQSEERIQKMKLYEEKLEEDKKNLRINLDDAENRVTKGEVARRALEGDLQRMKLALNDKETENQVLADRVEVLNRQIQDLETKAQSLQLTIDRLSSALAKSEEEEHSQKDKVQALNMTLTDTSATINELQERCTQLQRSLTSSEHDRRVLQEKLDSTRQALNEAKKQNHILMERVQALQNELSDSEVRRAELESQIRQAHTLLVQRQETEQELQQRMSKLQTEKQSLQERIASLQRNLANIEGEKRDIERSTVRLEKDKSALKKTLDKVEREKLRHEEFLSKSINERSSIDRTMSRLEEENIEMQRQIQALQAQLAQAEQEHSQRLIDLTTRHRQETEHETERLRSAQLQAERLLEARERAHRQRIKGLEEQISTLKDQLSQELRKRQQYISRSARTGEEIKDIRSVLDGSLGNVARDPSLDPLLLEYEQKKLDEAMDYHTTRKFPRRRHSPTRSTSPIRLGRLSTPLSRAALSLRRSTTSSPGPVTSASLR